MERIVRNGNLETTYGNHNFANPEHFDSHDPKQRAWVILNAGYVQAIVFAEYPAFTEQDALDEAVDRNRLDGLMCNADDLKDYQVGTDTEGNPEYEGIVNLGNAGEPFASESLDIWEMPASQFAEDTALMTHDRVTHRLMEQLEEAQRIYKPISAHDPAWLAAYTAVRTLEDSLLICYYANAR